MLNEISDQFGNAESHGNGYTASISEVIFSNLFVGRQKRKILRFLTWLKMINPLCCHLKLRETDLRKSEIHSLSYFRFMIRFDLKKHVHGEICFLLVDLSVVVCTQVDQVVVMVARSFTDRGIVASSSRIFASDVGSFANHNRVTPCWRSCP